MESNSKADVCPQFEQLIETTKVDTVCEIIQTIVEEQHLPPKPDVEQSQKRKVLDYLHSLPNDSCVSAEDAARVLNLPEPIVRTTMAEEVAERLSLVAPVSEVAAPAVVFTPVEPKEKVGEEGIDKTLERLRKVDDRFVDDFLKAKKKKTTPEALLGIKPEDVDPDSYEWTPIDWNLEATYAGWDTIGIRVRGKRQMKLFLSIHALRRALDLYPKNEDGTDKMVW